MDDLTTDLQWVREDGNLPSRVRSGRDGQRRTHTKSRNGCHSCRRSRIKCDETRPSCEQCQHRRRKCVYQSLEQGSLISTDDSVLQPQAELRLTTMSRALSRIQIDEILRHAGMQLMPSGVDHVQLLDHFSRNTSRWVGSATIQQGLQTIGLELAIQVPSLLHAILAFSASHISFSTSSKKSYNIASAVHFQQALHLYVNELDICDSLSSQHLDALFGNCLLVTMLGFAHLDDGDNIELKNRVDFGWVTTMQGMNVLMGKEVVKRHLDTSRWLQVFIQAESQAVKEEDSARRQKAATVVAMFMQICEVDYESPTIAVNPYRTPVELLMPLLTRSGGASLAYIVRYVCGLPESFVRLLVENDIRALLIMSHWCTVASGIEQWWVQEPAKVLHRRICARLRKIGHGQIIVPSGHAAQSFDGGLLTV